MLEGKINVYYSEVPRNPWQGERTFVSYGTKLPAHTWHWQARVVLDDSTECRAGTGYARSRFFAMRAAKKAVKQKIKNVKFLASVRERGVEKTYKI